MRAAGRDGVGHADQIGRPGALPNPTFSATKPAPATYPDAMSTGNVAASVAVAVPRRAAIDQAWRAIGEGVEVLSGADGGPLRRTVKRILDPLRVAAAVNPQFSAPMLEPDVAAQLIDAIVDNAERLRCAAAWFALLKAERRRLRITTGNAQELYFPVCFELAVTDAIRPSEIRRASSSSRSCATCTTTGTVRPSRCSIAMSTTDA